MAHSLSAAEAAKLPYRDCVGLVVQNAAGRLFSGERSDVPGAWQMPQGGIDPGETPETAALRELEEETAIRPADAEIQAQTQNWSTYDLPLDVIPNRWGGRFRGQRQKWFLIAFHGPDSAIRIDTDPAEFRRWAWKPPAAVLTDIIAFKRPLYRDVLTEFGLLT
ncbi:MAG: RNA pyrophosphohydrolase [Pseudomonadota bacterium]